MSRPGPERPLPKVVQVTAPARFGGLESVVALLSAGLADRGHRVTVVALHGTDPTDRCEPFQTLAAAGVELVEIRHPPRSYRAEIAAVRALLGDGDVVVHSHGYHADLVTKFAATNAGCRTVSTAHGFTGRGLKNRLYEWLDRRAIRGFDAVIAVSAPLEAVLRRSGVTRIHPIANAQPPAANPLSRREARDLLGLPPDRPVVGWVGRLTAEKGPEVFVRAMGRVAAEGSVGAVVGDGPMLAELRRLADLEAPDRISWLQGVSGASRYFAAFDVLAQSSYTEGTPMVLLEALGAGIPIVATGVGGVPDLLGSGVGLVVPAGEPASLARAIDETLSNPVAARDRAAAGLARVAADYAVGPWLDRHEALYRGLLCR